MNNFKCTIMLIANIIILQVKYRFGLAAAKKAPSRDVYENKTLFLKKTANSDASHELFSRRILDSSREGKTVSIDKLKKFKESKRRVEKIGLRNAINTESKTKFTNSSFSEPIPLRTLPNTSGYQIFKSRDINKNHASSDKINILSRSYLPQETLNALSKSLLVHPFKTWKLRHKFSSMKDIRIHEDKLHAVIDNPRNKRLRRKLNKVFQGRDVYLDVIGGSNTLGGGLTKEEGNTEGVYPKVIVDWWGKAITPITGSKLKLRQIAIGATSNEFFQFCFGSYIHEILDIFLIEMAVNDVRELPSNANKSIPLEQLTRQLLEYPTEPALIYVNVFDGKTCKENCVNLEDYGVGILSDTYNTTSLKLRDAVNCPKRPANKGSMLPACDVITSSDHFHINQLGHAHVSLMIINVFRKILLEHASSAMTNSRASISREKKSSRGLSSHAKSRSSGEVTVSSVVLPLQDENQFPREISHQKLPPPVFINSPSNVITKPLCWTSVRPFRFQNEVKINLDMVITRIEGFYIVQNERLDAVCKLPCRVGEYNSLTGRTVGASLALSFTVPEGISPGGIKSRSVAVALRVCVACGVADMWVDNDYKSKARIPTKFIYSRNSVRIAALRVEPGEHTLNVKIVKKGYVNIVGVMIGPSDGPY